MSLIQSGIEGLVPEEREVLDRLGHLDVDTGALAAVSNVFRVANAARNHMERTVLAGHELSFSAFTVLWVLWVWGEQEARHVAARAGITKGTLSGVVSTLERRGFVERRPHPSDGRLVLVSATASGRATMEELFPRFNAEEMAITAGLGVEGRRRLAESLRAVLRTLEVIGHPSSYPDAPDSGGD